MNQPTPNTVLPLKVIGQVITHAGIVMNEDYLNTERPSTDYLILEGMGQMLDAVAFGPEAAAPLCAVAALDLFNYVKWLNDGDITKLPAVPEGWEVLRAFHVEDEFDPSYTVLARSAWAAEQAVSYLDLAGDTKAGDPINLFSDEEMERWEPTVQITKLMLGNATRPGEETIYSVTETVAYEDLREQSRWSFDWQNDTMILAVVLGIVNETAEG